MAKIAATKNHRRSFEGDKSREDLVSVLGELHKIRNDISFLHEAIYKTNDDPYEDTRKVDITLPFLEQRVDNINEILEKYAAYLPEELREDL